MILVTVSKTKDGYTFSVAKDGKPLRSITGPQLSSFAESVPRALTKFPVDVRQFVERCSYLVDGISTSYLPLKLQSK